MSSCWRRFIFRHHISTLRNLRLNNQSGASEISYWIVLYHLIVFCYLRKVDMKVFSIFVTMGLRAASGGEGSSLPPRGSRAASSTDLYSVEIIFKQPDSTVLMSQLAHKPGHHPILERQEFKIVFYLRNICVILVVIPFPNITASTFVKSIICISFQ